MQDFGSFVLAHEPAIRLTAFAGVLAVLAGLEALAPRRGRSLPRLRRWPANLGIAVLNTLLVRIVFPTATAGLALVAEERGWGLFNILALPQGMEALLAVLVLDLAIYGQHVLFHSVPLLWRLHRLHHADLDIDVTTGARFHPIEIALSMMLKIAVVIALGAPAAAVVIFEVLLNANSMFNHANVKIPLRIDRMLRLFIVTPDMHRVHHSVLPRETNSNFGFQVPWWDWIFGTYSAQPAAGHDAMTIGLEYLRDPAELGIGRMLVQPLANASDGYPILFRKRGT